MKNSKRFLVRILDEIAEKHHLKINKISYDWIIQLIKGDKHKFVFAYYFEINSSTSQMIADDKSATSELLMLSNIPVVEHKLFLSPNMEKYVSSSGNSHKIIDYFNENNHKIVCKPNIGTGGNNVFKCESLLELEKNIQNLFIRHRSICLSPYIEVKKEYRAILLDGNIELFYAKEIPYVIGNGILSVNDLVKKKYKTNYIAFVSSLEKTGENAGKILDNKQVLKLHWKSNLGKGAYPIIIEERSEKYTQIMQLAKRAANAINIRFASVDIIETEKNELLVLEINAGVMIEHFLKRLPKQYSKVKSVYEKAVLKMLEVED